MNNQPTTQELTKREKRHEIYAFLAGIGAQKMGEGEENRTKLRNLFDEYERISFESLKRDLTMANRTNQERNKARKEKLARKRAKKQAEQSVITA